MKVKKLVVQIIFGMLVCLLLSIKALAADSSPVGYWNTVDDKSGQVLSVVQIYAAGKGLEGKVVKIMPVMDQKQTDLCVNCRGELQNHRIMGMKIMWGMEPISSDTWGKGRILDPKSGNVYQGTMTLENSGNSLNLRGYVGVPMFGRTETWTRTTN